MVNRALEFSYKVFERLKDHFGIPLPPLNFQTPEQLAIAVILSAQCTDERVNLVTPALFQKYPKVSSLANAKPADIEKLVFSTGFYRNKARNIQNLAKILVKQYHGKIPADFDILVTLPGIGRKTANVIMNIAFQKSCGIVVDTHVMRITKLLGFTKGKNAVQIEKDLMRVWPPELWMHFSLLLVYHGRKFCVARRPHCQVCILNDICPSSKIH